MPIRGFLNRMTPGEEELIARHLLEHQDEIDVCFKNKEWAKLAALVRYARNDAPKFLIHTDPARPPRPRTRLRRPRPRKRTRRLTPPTPCQDSDRKTSGPKRGATLRLHAEVARPSPFPRQQNVGRVGTTRRVLVRSWSLESGVVGKRPPEDAAQGTNPNVGQPDAPRP